MKQQCECCNESITINTKLLPLWSGLKLAIKELKALREGCQNIRIKSWELNIPGQKEYFHTSPFMHFTNNLYNTMLCVNCFFCPEHRRIFISELVQLKKSLKENDEILNSLESIVSISSQETELLIVMQVLGHQINNKTKDLITHLDALILSELPNFFKHPVIKSSFRN